jgi:hypothetical protein
MPFVELQFNPSLKAVADEGFERRLALAALDVLLGREAACAPDPVPLDEDSETRMIGSGNDHWLKRLERPGRYALVSRHLEPGILEAAATLLSHRFRNLLPPDVEKNSAGEDAV